MDYNDKNASGNRYSSWWRHQMEIFPALLALCAGIHWSPANSFTKASNVEFDAFSDLHLNKRLSK